MIYFSTPYAFDKRLFNAYDSEFQRLPNSDDWLVLMDGDIAFLRADFGHHIQEYINKFPGTGLFTCYASRSHYKYIVPMDGNDRSPDIIFHKKIADAHARDLHLAVKPLEKNISGQLMAIRKDTWLSVRDDIAARTKNETIEAIDTAIGKVMHEHNLPVLLMRGIYVLHYCRMLEGYKHRAHLGYNNFLYIITPCSRMANLAKLSESINIPRRMYRWIVVVDAHQPHPDQMPKFPSNAEVYFLKDKNSKVGNAQRNFALHLINSDVPDNAFGKYVYFLDDDTLLHPDLYQTINELKNDFIHFNQQNPDGSHRIGGAIKLNQVDTGSVVAKLSLIGQQRWIVNAYNGDGMFWEGVFSRAKNPVYVNKFLSVYNQLNP